jgi:hypothetical protein
VDAPQIARPGIERVELSLLMETSNVNGGDHKSLLSICIGINRYTEDDRYMQIDL